MMKQTRFTRARTYSIMGDQDQDFLCVCVCVVLFSAHSRSRKRQTVQDPQCFSNDMFGLVEFSLLSVSLCIVLWDCHVPKSIIYIMIVPIALWLNFVYCSYFPFSSFVTIYCAPFISVLSLSGVVMHAILIHDRIFMIFFYNFYNNTTMHKNRRTSAD